MVTGFPRLRACRGNDSAWSVASYRGYQVARVTMEHSLRVMQHLVCELESCFHLHVRAWFAARDSVNIDGD